jgi:hypothetical protein
VAVGLGVVGRVLVAGGEPTGGVGKQQQSLAWKGGRSKKAPALLGFSVLCTVLPSPCTLPHVRAAPRLRRGAPRLAWTSAGPIVSSSGIDTRTALLEPGPRVGLREAWVGAWGGGRVGVCVMRLQETAVVPV